MGKRECADQHEGFEMPDDVEKDGRRFGAPGTLINGEAIAAAMGAAYEGCQPCQRTAVDTIAADPLTTTRVVELAAVMTQSAFGGVPAAMLTEDGPSTMTEPFRALLRAGLDGQYPQMFQRAQAMTDKERRQAVEDALDMLTGFLAATGHAAVAALQARLFPDHPIR